MRYPPWSSFYFRSTYAEREIAEIPNPPLELNPYLPWWWRFERSTLIGVVCICAGSGIVLQFEGIAWLWDAETALVVGACEYLVILVGAISWAARRR